jgi:hypothetical protein
MEVDNYFAKTFEVKDYHGYNVPFSRQQSVHAKYKNGSYVVKANSDPKDKHKNGARGIVLGSIGTEATTPPAVVYYVSFDRDYVRPVIVLEKKLEAWVALP